MRIREEACWDSSTGEADEGYNEVIRTGSYAAGADHRIGRLQGRARGQEDRHYTDDDTSSLEYMHSDSKQEDIFDFDEEWLDVPTQVARRLLHRRNGAEDRGTISRVS